MAIYTVKNSTDKFTLAMGVYGTIDELVKLCVDNNFTIDNIGAVPGSQLQYDPSLVVPISPVQSQQPQQAAPPLTITFKSVYGQNQFDVALNAYGSIDNYIKMLVDNNVENDYVPNGKVYTFDLHLIKDVNIYNTTTAKGIVFSTGNIPQLPVFAEENNGPIFISEDGSEEFTPEN